MLCPSYSSGSEEVSVEEVSERSIANQDLLLGKVKCEGSTFVLTEPKATNHQITAHETRTKIQHTEKRRWEFGLSVRCARSYADKSSRLPVQPNRMKTQSFHLYFAVFSPHFTMTTTVTSVVNNRPNMTSAIRSTARKLSVWLSSECMGRSRIETDAVVDSAAQLRGQRNPGEVETLLTVYNAQLTKAKIVPAPFSSRDRVVTS